MVKNNKKSLVLIILSVVFVFAFLPFKEAKAAITDNMSGWAWSENIGWISFNCTNQASCSATNNYGVNADLVATGLLSGYAWSENIGWITFNSSELGGCPSGTCEAKFASNEFSGWARACSVFQSGCSGATSTNTGGWDGWIHLKGSNYGVVLDASYELKGYASGGWGDSGVIGWISFNCSNGGSAVCAVSPYKVIINNPKPSAQFLTVDGDNPLDYCLHSDHPPVRLRWTFVGGDATDVQTQYEIQISKFSNFSSLVEDATGTDSAMVTAKNLDYGGVTYFWRLKVWGKSESDWITGPPFTTIQFAYPDPDFTWSPNKIIVGKTVTFDGSALTYFYGGPHHWKWDFNNDGTFDYEGDNASTATTSYSYSKSIYRVKLEVGVGARTCSITKPITSVMFGAPIWTETPAPTK